MQQALGPTGPPLFSARELSPHACGRLQGNTGNENVGQGNVGNQNVGQGNTGNENVGQGNTGNQNIGQGNTGNQNNGAGNTGNQNNGEVSPPALLLSLGCCPWP